MTGVVTAVVTSGGDCSDNSDITTELPFARFFLESTTFAVHERIRQATFSIQCQPFAFPSR
jgi:hypothetical protein